MLLTEEEAKTKWCPMVRAVAIRGGTFGSPEPIGNRIAADQNELPKVTQCIASGCMMWRQHASDESWTVQGESKTKTLPAGLRRGYCGLAGKPEVA